MNLGGVILSGGPASVYGDDAPDVPGELLELGVPVLFTVPHSYSACPTELLFAAFKAKDINPRLVPTGKK